MTSVATYLRSSLQPQAGGANGSVTVSVYVGPDETITALTDDGIEELTDLIKAARLTTRTWHELLDDFVDDKDLVLRIKAKLPR